MNVRVWVGAALLVGCGWWQPVRAAGLLYRPDPAATRLTAAPGQALTDLGSERWLNSSAAVADLSLNERRTLQPNYSYHALWLPNDPDYPLQWNLSNINMPAAWDAQRGGDSRIVVAVLDTGLAFETYQNFRPAPDLAQTNIWTNPAEIAGDGLDNDHDGLVDDVHGWNFVDGNAHPDDNNGHGTHIAGIISSSTDNSLAIAGIAFKTTMMPLKVLDGAGDGTTATIAAAINYAVAHGANIINLSLGGNNDDPVLHQAIQQAVAQGVLVIGAAGNTGDGTVTYPARYPEVISVGAVQVDDTRAPYSNYGSTLDLVAPGGNLSLDQNHDGQPDGIPAQTCTDATCSAFATYLSVGTSQAAAHVSAVAALLEACGAASGTIRTTLESSATDLGPPGRDDQFGFGLVNAAAALAQAGCQSAAPAPPNPISATASASELTPVWPDQYATFTKPKFAWSGATGVAYHLTWSKGATVLIDQRQTADTFSPTLTSEGTYTLAVTVVDSLGQTSTAQEFIYRYRAPVVLVASGKTVSLLSATLKTIRSWLVATAPSGVAGGQWSSDNTPRVVVDGKSGTMSILDTHGHLVKTLTPFGSKFTGQISDVILRNVKNQPVLVVATATRGAELRWYSTTGTLLGRDLLYGSYRGGLTLSRGDVDADGNDELIVSQVAGPEVRVYNQQRVRLAVITPLGKKYAGGWQAAVADSDHDGKPELVLLPEQGTKRTVWLTTLHGVIKSRWTLTGWPSGAVLNLLAIDRQGTGVDELYVVPARGPAIIQEWSLSGRRLRQTTLNVQNVGLIGQL